MRSLMVLGLAAALLAGCAGGSGDAGGDGDGMAVPSGAWQKFEAYKGNLTPSSDEYFAVSSDGGWASNTDKDQAIKDCQQYAKVSCVLFAHNDEILVPYHVE